MEKRQLTDILHHFTSSTPQEAEEIVALRNHYPYSQLLQTLAARVSKDHNFSSHELLLQSAAVHATDRAVLKEIMMHTHVPGIQQAKPEPVVGSPGETGSIIAVNQTIDTVDYAEEVMLDLKKLNELKTSFENLVANLNAPVEEQVKSIKRPPGRPRKKIEPETDVLIESIKANKKEIDPESPKTAEQIAIIDQFIKAQPNIASKVKPNNAPAADLSSNIKSGEYPESIISETLAEILIRQGKKEKAIEVYKKLIWKFPQKKAYFAGQIEDLKK